MDEEKFKKDFEKFYPGSQLKLRPEEKAKRHAKRLKFSLTLFGLFIGMCILTGAPAYAYLICPFIGIMGYYGLKQSELDKED
tara:strand:- start:247 stop:492 length:246 start_codon:yes stop_codon:yes gene_type:complete